MPVRFRLSVYCMIYYANHAPLAQLDRVSDYESEGYRFNSCRVRYKYK